MNRLPAGELSSAFGPCNAPPERCIFYRRPALTLPALKDGASRRLGEIGPLPLIETEEATLVALLPGELSPGTVREGRVCRDGSGLRVRIPEMTLLFDLRAERALRMASRLLLVEAAGDQAHLLGELVLAWDL